MKNIFSVDVEDWYHGFAPSIRVTEPSKKRLEYGMHQLLDMLDEKKIQATFFWLGECALNYPFLLHETHKRGHEIGCHGYNHKSLFSLTPLTFREELERSLHIIGAVTGEAVQCYRAPYFSLRHDTWWALEILREHGILYDSSILPMHHWRTGISGYSDRIGVIQTPAGDIVEVPITVNRIAGKHLPTSGGGYFRLYPYSLTQKHIREKNAQEQPAVFYIHPWELDPEQPRVRTALLHYIGLQTTARKVTALLNDHEFGSLIRICNMQLATV